MAIAGGSGVSRCRGVGVYMDGVSFLSFGEGIVVFEDFLVHLAGVFFRALAYHGGGSSSRFLGPRDYCTCESSRHLRYRRLILVTATQCRV